jgi:NAD(P)-dependent dehydrogenase (short-subunit alcohol dehydrogenase family)
MKRTAVITGSASGIGKATRELLLARGYRVIGVDLHDAEIIADLAKPEGREAMIYAVRWMTRGVVDAVVANAGLALPEPITGSVNYFGAIAALEGLQPLLVKGQQPRAVFVASLANTFPHDVALVEAYLAGDELAALKTSEGKGNLIYASTKVAATRWARQHAIKPDWAGAGILLNIVAPGLIQTPMTQAMIDDPKTMENFKGLLPMPIGRYGQPEEVAELIAFLVSPENSLMVGQVIFIDSGSEATTRGELGWISTPQPATAAG